MTDTLRERIAKVLHQRSWCRDGDVEQGWVWTWEQESEEEQRSWLEDADAVIAALGARVQWRNDFYINTGQPPDDYTGPIRYVTDWQADE